MFSMSSTSKYLGNFDFSMKTSSGDKVELSAYNRQESDFETTKDKNHKSFIQESLLDKLDEMLYAFKVADDMREFAKDVFDMLKLHERKVYALDRSKSEKQNTIKTLQQKRA